MSRTDPLTAVSTRRTPQSQPADKRQVPNSAGGYTFTVTPEQQLRRFLVLGTDGATYYAGAAELTRDNAQVVLAMAEREHGTLLRVLLEVSLSGAAPKQNPTLFALAVACSVGAPAERAAALQAIPSVCRTGTMLFQFATYVEQFRGWGRALKRGIAEWYVGDDTTKFADHLAFQMIKYRQRDGWTHADLLRLSKPGSKGTRGATRGDAVDSLLGWAVGKPHGTLPRIVEGYLLAQEPDADYAALITAYGLPWEALPDVALNDPKTWEALLDKGMPATALMRQLPRLTRLGLLPQMGGRTSAVAAQLADPDRLAKARVHPVNVLVAQRTYASGRSARGSGEWDPTAKIVDALDAAFYAAYGAIEPSGKRRMEALDVSGSMGSPISNMPITCREASAALALVSMNVEADALCVGFTSGGGGRPSYDRFHTALSPLAISPRQRLDDAIATVSRLPFGGTDCALPMIEAKRRKLEVDLFTCYTDNETWYGDVHPHQALEEYRQSSGIDAKLVVVGMTATPFSIADPTDAGMMDVAGFDSAVPDLVTAFARGDV